MSILTFVTVSTVLLIVCVQAAPRDTDTCDSRQYVINGVCCNRCQPGYKVYQHCTSQPDDGVCMPCSEGYYQNDWSGAAYCHPINKCDKSHEHIQVAAKLDGTSDNQCACDTGYQYSASGELCLRAYQPITTPSQGPSLTSSEMPILESTSESASETSGNTTELHVPSTVHPTHLPPPHQDAMNALIGILVFVVLTVIVIFIILYLCYHKRWCCFKYNERGETSQGDVEDRIEQNLLMVPPTVDTGSQRDEGFGTGTTTPRSESAASLENQTNRYSSESGVSEEDIPVYLNGLEEGYQVPSDDNRCIGMAVEDTEILRKLMPNFVTDLPLPLVLDRMPDVFCIEDVEAIKKPALDECEQRRECINKLMTKGPDAFDKFLAVLDVVCEHLAVALRHEKEQLSK